MPKHTLHVIGIDAQVPNQQLIGLLKNSRTVVLSGRHRAALDDIVPDHDELYLISITPLQQALDEIEKRLQIEDVVVLASGDPLFFGIGRRLLETFAGDSVRIYPAISSMQYICARFKIVWQDARFISLHGKEEDNLAAKVARQEKTVILTDNKNNPAVIARQLLDFYGAEDAKNFLVHVGENLAAVNERLTTGGLAEISQMSFDPLCSMVVVNKNIRQPQTACFGLQEQEIVHSRGLITKNEIRAAVLHALRLHPEAILWDIGAGSGSVGLEAARMQPDLLVYAIEKDPAQLSNIIANKNRHNVLNLKQIEGCAPEALTGLPRPHRIFVGGSGGHLAAILSAGVAALHDDGIVVVTGVLEKTAKTAPEIMCQLGLGVETKKITVTRTTYPQEETTNLNPITIIVGTKVVQ